MAKSRTKAAEPEAIEFALFSKLRATLAKAPDADLEDAVPAAIARVAAEITPDLILVVQARDGVVAVVVDDGREVARFKPTSWRPAEGGERA